MAKRYTAETHTPGLMAVQAAPTPNAPFVPSTSVDPGPIRHVTIMNAAGAVTKDWFGRLIHNKRWQSEARATKQEWKTERAVKRENKEIGKADLEASRGNYVRAEEHERAAIEAQRKAEKLHTESALYEDVAILLRKPTTAGNAAIPPTGAVAAPATLPQSSTAGAFANASTAVYGNTPSSVPSSYDSRSAYGAPLSTSFSGPQYNQNAYPSSYANPSSSYANPALYASPSSSYAAPLSSPYAAPLTPYNSAPTASIISNSNVAPPVREAIQVHPSSTMMSPVREEFYMNTSGTAMPPSVREEIYVNPSSTTIVERIVAAPNSYITPATNTTYRT